MAISKQELWYLVISSDSLFIWSYVKLEPLWKSSCVEPFKTISFLITGLIKPFSCKSRINAETVKLLNTHPLVNGLAVSKAMTKITLTWGMESHFKENINLSYSQSECSSGPVFNVASKCQQCAFSLNLHIYYQNRDWKYYSCTSLHFPFTHKYIHFPSPTRITEMGN